MIVEYEGQKYYYPDTTDPQSFPDGARIFSGNDPSVELPETYKPSQLEAGISGGLSGITGGPVTGPIFKSIMPKEMKLLQQSTKEAKENYPVTAGLSELGTEMFASPEGILGGKLLSAGGKALAAPIKKGVERRAKKAAAAMIENETGIIPRQEDLLSIARDVAEKATSAGTAWRATKPAVGAAVGGAAGSAVPGFGYFGGHSGAVLGARLMGAPKGSFFHTPIEALLTMLQSPAVKYQAASKLPQLGRFAIPALPRTDFEE